ncbi:MAG: electron transfer flavoprotein subunit alpha/FixB family protein [Dehalococcoidia bacterium]
MANESGVLVIAELAEGAVAPVTLEVLGAARRLADQLGQPVQAALLGQGVEPLAKELIAAGADKVYVADDPILAEYQSDAYVPAAEKVCREANPSVVLLGQTDIGRDLAPRLAFRLGTAVAMDCLDLAIADGRLVMTRACYGGNANAQHTTKTMPQMATVRVKSQEPLAPDASRQGEVIKVDAGVDPSAVRTKIVGRRKVEVEGIRLEDAEVVVGGGRGMGSVEGFQTLEELASLLKGAVGATRAACDMGWYPVPKQIGLTGKVISPTLYIAVAISGASQHMAGLSGAKNIIAVNKDPEANIFRYCRYGIVGDWKQVIPPFLNKVRQLKAE